MDEATSEIPPKPGHYHSFAIYLDLPTSHLMHCGCVLLLPHLWERWSDGWTDRKTDRSSNKEQLDGLPQNPYTFIICAVAQDVVQLCLPWTVWGVLGGTGLGLQKWLPVHMQNVLYTLTLVVLFHDYKHGFKADGMSAFNKQPVWMVKKVPTFKLNCPTKIDACSSSLL